MDDEIGMANSRLSGTRIPGTQPMPIFASVFIALNEAGVPFLVIRGHAVVLHGHEPNLEDSEAWRLARKSAVKFRY